MTLLPTLLLAALPVMAQGTDRIALRFVVHDDEALELTQPAVQLDNGEVVLVPLLDDGSLEGDLPGDHIWQADAEIRRVQKLDFTLIDTATGEAHGSESLFLPAAGSATINVRTQVGELPMVVDGAGGASVSGDGSEGPKAPPTTSEVVQTDAERFTYLLWVVLLIGLLGFGYLRVVVRRLYVNDFLPTWRKLDRWLDRELAERDEP